ncbi:MAG: hypothetical protein KC493_08780, partial [Bacteriovoracaceae bacterium]|nr:hypothetical protein [Bacteriovoracaceae bacterium]
MKILKVLLPLLLLSVLTSCSEEEVAKSRTCYYNDEQVDCAALDGAGTSSARTGATLLVSAVDGFKTYEDVDGIQYVEFDGVKKEESDSKGNTCYIDTTEWSRLSYKISEDGKVITMTASNGESESFNRVGSSDSENQIVGTWKAESHS